MTDSTTVTRRLASPTNSWLRRSFPYLYGQSAFQVPITSDLQKMAEDSAPLHVVMFPFFAFGHISPFAQLSNKLASNGVRVSFLSAPGNVSRVQSMLSDNPNTRIISLQVPSIEGIPSNLSSTSDLPASVGKNLVHVLDLMQSQIRTLLADLQPGFVFFDFAQHWLPAMAAELGIKTLFFSVFSAVATAYLTIPARIRDINGGITADDLRKPPKGFPEDSGAYLREFEAKDIMFLFTKFDDGPTGYERVLTGLTGCSAIVAKTCNDLEGQYIDFVKKQFQKKIYLTGPLVPDPPSGILDEKWQKWLDNFPEKSVIFCSFGSETFLKDEQIKELASGLELAGLPFFLVLNFQASSNGAGTSLEEALPEGFQERVKDRGIVLSGWVQQPLILRHRSVGCYLCHSGFSSVIEALVNDCNLVLLPLKGDQFLNAKLISGDLKVGVEINRRDEDGYFGKEDVCEAVRKVMANEDDESGKTARENHKKWREFLLDNEIQSKFIADLIQDLKNNVSA